MLIMMVLRQPNAMPKTLSNLAVDVIFYPQIAYLTLVNKPPNPLRTMSKKKGIFYCDDLPKDTKLCSKNARVDDSPLKLSLLKTSKRHFPTFIPNSTCTKRAK